MSSNPTNLVLSGAFSLSFVTYTSRLILPVVVSAIAVYPVLTFGLFRAPGLIPQTIELHFDRDEAGGQEGSAALVDKRGAIFGSVVLLLTLGALVGTSVIHVPVWWVTVPPALTMLARDAAHDWMQQPQTQTSGSLGLQNSSAQAYPLQDLSQEQSKSPAVETVSTRHPKTLCSLMVQWTAVFKRTFPTVVTVASRLPVALVPFAFLMFILVQSLASKGWVELLSSWWASWVEKTGVVGAVFGMGVVSCLFCNVCRFPTLRDLQLTASIDRSAGRTLALQFSLRGFSRSISRRTEIQSAPHPARGSAKAPFTPWLWARIMALSHSLSRRRSQDCYGVISSGRRGSTCDKCNSCARTYPSYLSHWWSDAPRC